jgi:hypothetical protein
LSSCLHCCGMWGEGEWECKGDFGVWERGGVGKLDGDGMYGILVEQLSANVLMEWEFGLSLEIANEDGSFSFDMEGMYGERYCGIWGSKYLIGRIEWSPGLGFGWE